MIRIMEPPNRNKNMGNRTNQLHKGSQQGQSRNIQISQNCTNEGKSKNNQKIFEILLPIQPTGSRKEHFPDLMHSSRRLILI